MTQLNDGKRSYDPSCVFCQRVKNKEFTVTANREVVHFEPLNPVVPGHQLFIPISHRQDATTAPSLTGVVMGAASVYARTMGKPCNLLTSVGEEATQSIFHLHIHYVPREKGDGLLLPWTVVKSWT